MGISFAAMISMITTQHKEGKAIQQQLASASLKYAVLQTLRNPENCICQFNSLTIDTTKTALNEAGDEIDLQVFKNGCGTDPNNIIANAGKEVGAGLKVESVKVSNIMETGTPNEYFGDLIIAYKGENLVRALRPLEVPLQFTVTPPSDPSDSSERPITLCGANTDVGDQISALTLELGNHNLQIIDQNQRILEIENIKLASLAESMDELTEAIGKLMALLKILNLDKGQLPEETQELPEDSLEKPPKKKTITYNISSFKCEVKDSWMAKCAGKFIDNPTSTDRQVCAHGFDYNCSLRGYSGSSKNKFTMRGKNNIRRCPDGYTQTSNTCRFSKTTRTGVSYPGFPPAPASVTTPACTKVCTLNEEP